MRVIGATAIMIAVVVSSGCSTAPQRDPSVASPSVAATAPRFVGGSFDIWVPVDVARYAGPNCGFPADWKFAARLAPPVEVSTAVWQIDGCIASPGNVFHDVTILLSFPDGSEVAQLAARQTAPDTESLFSVIVRRERLDGISARVYCNYTAKS